MLLAKTNKPVYSPTDGVWEPTSPPILAIIYVFLFTNVIGKNDLIFLFKKSDPVYSGFRFCNPSLFFPEDEGLASAGSASRWSPDHGWGLSLHPACSSVK